MPGSRVRVPPLLFFARGASAQGPRASLLSSGPTEALLPPGLLRTILKDVPPDDFVRAMEADETAKRGRNAVQEELHIQRLMPADALRIRGRHNAVNALAALALANLYQVRYRLRPHGT